METVHVVAINPYRKGNKGKVFSYNIDTYDKVSGSKEIKKMIQQIRGELPIDGVDLNDAQAVKKAQERLKSELPFFCPHYGMFKNNVRRQENALPESFLFQTIIDVDDKEYVEKAIEKARELNCSSGIWNGSLLHLCYSARKKLHIGIRMPVGMTIEETQKAYCEALGVPYDESCITPERMIFLTDKDSEIYRSKMWCAVLPESEIQARRKAFLDRGLTVDGRGDAKVNSLQFTVNGNSNDNVQNNRLSGNHGSGELGEASEKNLIAFDLFVQSAGLEGMAIDTVGSRHSSLLAIMSAGASRVMSEEELMKVVRTKMPSYYQEPDCHQLIHDFYAKYADSSKPMSRDVIRVNALAEQKANEVKSEERRVKNSNADGNYTVQSSNLQVQSSDEDYPEPPVMPEKLPKLVELLISRTPEIYKPAVAHAIFPPLATHLWQTSFRYIDNVVHEATLSTCLLAGSVLRRRTTLRLGLSASCSVTSATGSAAGGSASTLALRVRVARGFLAGAASTPSASVWTVRRRTTRFFGSAGSSDGVSIWLSSGVVVITLTVLLSFSLFGFGSFLWPVGYALCAFCSFVFLFGRLVAEHQFKFFAWRHIAR